MWRPCLPPPSGRGYAGVRELVWNKGEKGQPREHRGTEKEAVISGDATLQTANTTHSTKKEFGP